MSTIQPTWKYAGHIGDVDPIAHGGAFVYIDTTGVYCPEMTFFEPAADETWDRLGGKSPLVRYRVLLENDSEREWWYEKLSEIVSFTGQTIEVLRGAAKSANPLERAWLYNALIQYHGIENFDSYPAQTTEDEAYTKYAYEMRQSQQGN